MPVHKFREEEEAEEEEKVAPRGKDAHNGMKGSKYQSGPKDGSWRPKLSTASLVHHAYLPFLLLLAPVCFRLMGPTLPFCSLLFQPST